MMSRRTLSNKRAIADSGPNAKSDGALKSSAQRSRPERPENLDAYDLYLRAFPIAFTTTPQIVDKAFGPA